MQRDQINVKLDLNRVEKLQSAVLIVYLRFNLAVFIAILEELVSVMASVLFLGLRGRR